MLNPQSPEPSRVGLLRRQFDLTWGLFEFHLEGLKPNDFLWEPAPVCWTLHRGAEGVWVPDFQDTEPDPVPIPTIAWVTWHIGWWWSVTIDRVQGRPPRDRSEIVWPGAGEASAVWLRGLRDQWLTLLDGFTETGLDAPTPFPWPGQTEMTLADTAAWVNAELMKNAAEIGQLRMLRAVSAA